MVEKIKLNLSNSSHEALLVDALCKVMKDLLNQNQKSLINDIIYVVEHLEWRTFGGNKAEHYAEFQHMLEDAKLLYISDYDPISLRVTCSNLDDLQAALLPLYEDLCYRQSNSVSTLTMTSESMQSRLLALRHYSDAADTTFQIISRLDRLCEVYRPNDYHGSLDLRLFRMAKYFYGFREHLIDVIERLESAIDDLDTLYHISTDRNYFDEVRSTPVPAPEH